MSQKIWTALVGLGLGGAVIAQTVNLTGKVIETLSGTATAVPSAKVKLLKLNQSTTANAQGNFAFTTTVAAVQLPAFARLDGQILSVQLSHSGSVRIEAINHKGQVTELLSKEYSAGQLALNFDDLARELPMGAFQMRVMTPMGQAVFKLDRSAKDFGLVATEQGALANAVDTLLVSKTGYADLRMELSSYVANLGNVEIFRLSSSSGSSSAALSSSAGSSSSSAGNCVNWSPSLYTWNGTVYSGPSCVVESGTNYECVSNLEPYCNAYSPITNAFGQWRVLGSTSSSAALSSSSLAISSSVLASSSSVAVSSVAASSAALSSVAVSSAALSSVAVSSAALSSSAASCNRTLVSGYYFNVTSGLADLAGYQQSNYSAFAAGDQVVIQGRPCSEAATVDVEPAGNSWNLYLTLGYSGNSGTKVLLEKVSGNLSATSSSSAATSSAVVTSSAALSSSSTAVSSSSVSGTALNSLITQAQFDAMFPNRGSSSCKTDGANTVYTYANFISAAATFPLFAQEGTDEVRKREIAAFLGQTSHETTGGGGSWCGGTSSPTSSCFKWGLCYTKEVGCTNATCTSYNDPSNATYPVVAGKSYFGRGPIQLSWNVNYGQASAAIFGDKMTLLNNPDQVSTNGVVAFKTALWFWMTAQAPKPSAHDVMIGKTTTATSGGRDVGYGLVTNIINGGIECGTTANISKQDDRVNFFKNHAASLGVSAKPSGSTLTDAQYFYCTNQTHF